MAPTPPMGWNSWNRFRLNIDDAIIRAEAQAMVTNGMKAVGYKYIVIDGGWEGYHDTNGVFIPDTNEFPDMKALCDYIHSLGLKVGIHTSPGPTTCSGREGSYGHEEQDARTFAGWGIDFVKYDWCSADSVYKPSQMQAVYRKMHDALAETGRPMLYSLCQYGMQNVWEWGASVGGNIWRTTGDISDNYNSMACIGFSQNGLEKYAGPGHWNDPDMLEIGNGGMTTEGYHTQMSLWCLLAAPLFAGNDLTKMSTNTLAILTNPEVIAVDQDPAGIQGRRVWQEGPLEIWMKPLSDGSQAVGLFNREGFPMTMTLNFKVLGLTEQVEVRDLWERKSKGIFNQSFTTQVPQRGVVLLKVKSAPSLSQKKQVQKAAYVGQSNWAVTP
jgi:alpha-galactosidase